MLGFEQRQQRTGRAPCAGGRHRSRPRVPAAGLQRSPQPCTPAPLREIRRLYLGGVVALLSAVAGRAPAGKVRRGRLSTASTGTPVLAWWPPRRRGDHLVGGAGGPGSASAPERGQPPALRQCARPSRGTGRQSPGSARGCAHHRPLLRFSFFAACSRLRRWATRRSSASPRVQSGCAAAGPAPRLGLGRCRCWEPLVGVPFPAGPVALATALPRPGPRFKACPRSQTAAPEWAPGGSQRKEAAWPPPGAGPVRSGSP